MWEYDVTTWDADTGKSSTDSLLSQSAGDLRTVASFAFTCDCEKLLYTDGNGEVHCWSIDEKRDVCSWSTVSEESAASATEGTRILLQQIGQVALIAHPNHQSRLSAWQIDGCKVAQWLDAFTPIHNVRDPSVSFDGDFFATTAEDNDRTRKLRLRDLKTGDVTFEYCINSDGPTRKSDVSLTFSECGQMLLSRWTKQVSEDVVIWDLNRIRNLIAQTKPND